MHEDETRERAFRRMLECLEAQSYKPDDIIFVEMIFDKMTDLIPKKYRHVKLMHTRLPGEKSFPDLMNKSWCINVGVRRAKHDDIVVADADILYGDGYFRRIDEFKEGKKFFQCYKQIVIEQGRDNPEPRIRRAWEFRTAGGVWYIKRDFFWSIGGMNESYFGYGGEDQDFWERAKFVIGEPPYMDYELTHAYHHWHTGHYGLNKDRAQFLYRTENDFKGTIEKLRSLELGTERPQPIYDTL